jgi:HJR/Mrr/RecB family endonuclease
MHVYIKKADGTKELFDEKKLKASLRNSGADKKTIDEIIAEITDIAYEGITSDAIYKIASKLLRGKSKKASMRYNLTNAVALLGPEGFAFEAFLAEIVKAHGYKNVTTGKKIKGRCMVHELDVVGENDDERVTIEAKFHNSRSKKSDLQVILYMKARFQDILESGYYADKKPKQIIITNTKFTDNAKKYAKCSETEVIS